MTYSCKLRLKSSDCGLCASLFSMMTLKDAAFVQAS